MPASSSPAPHPERSVHFPVSAFFLVGIVAAITSSIAVGVATVIANAPMPPRPGGDGPPPPPPQTSMIALNICIGLFIISWITVAAAIARDQILRRMQAASEHRTGVIDELRAEVVGLRGEVERGRRADRAFLEEHLGALAHYGEQRETEGYLSAMRDTAAGKGEIRALRPRTKD